MRILRSKYLQYQESITKTTTLTTFKTLKTSSSLSPTTSEQCSTNDEAGAASNRVQITRRRSVFMPQEAVHISSNAWQAQPIEKRRQTVAHCSEFAPKVTTQLTSNNFEIKLLNLQRRNLPFNIVISFYDEGPQWYTRLYRSYEGEIWHRVERKVPLKTCKWYFKCHICCRQLGNWTSMKGHLNLHLGFFPNRCAECPKKYPSRNSLTRHRRSTSHAILGGRSGIDNKDVQMLTSCTMDDN